jgi:hypothetical protein
MNSAMEQYCDALLNEQLKSQKNTSLTVNLLGNKKEVSLDIQNITFARLRNVAFAMTKIREVYGILNVSTITTTVRLHRKSMAQLKPQPANDSVAGAFKIHVAYGENIKSTMKTGFSNPYVILRVPEGTLIPLDESVLIYKKKSRRNSVDSDIPVVLKGTDCELFRYCFLTLDRDILMTR